MIMLFNLIEKFVVKYDLYEINFVKFWFDMLIFMILWKVVLLKFWII